MDKSLHYIVLITLVIFIVLNFILKIHCFPFFYEAEIDQYINNS